MEHGKHRRHSDSGTQQNNRSVAWPQREAAACRAYVDSITNLQFVVEVSAGRAMVFPLDAHPIIIGASLPRQRVAAHQRRRRWRREPQHDKLSWKTSGDGLSVRGIEQKGSHVAALADFTRYPKWAESAPCRGRAVRSGETGVSRGDAVPVLLCEQRFKGVTPAD